MYIEFTLAGTTANRAYITTVDLRERITNWATKFSVQYRIKFVKYTCRVTFDDDKYYNLFSLTWDTTIPFRIVVDLNNRLD